MSTRTGIWSSGATTSLRLSGARAALRKCRRRRRCCAPIGEGEYSASVTGPSLGSSLLQGAVGDDCVSLHAPKPTNREIVALSRHCDGSIGTAAAFIDLALG